MNEKQEHCLIFQVIDTGIGIYKKQQNKIFEPFTQINTTSQYGVTGLGLAISMQLTKAMNGTIELQSELGKGSQFTFTIPIQLDIQEDI